MNESRCIFAWNCLSFGWLLSGDSEELQCTSLVNISKSPQTHKAHINETETEKKKKQFGALESKQMQKKGMTKFYHDSNDWFVAWCVVCAMWRWLLFLNFFLFGRVRLDLWWSWYSHEYKRTSYVFMEWCCIYANAYERFSLHPFFFPQAAMGDIL